MKKALAFCCALALAQAVDSQVVSQTRIPIAIPQFKNLGSQMKGEEAEALQSLLETAIVNQPIFIVLERGQAQAVFQEFSEQISLAGAETPLDSQVRTSARALLIGSIGMLYNRIVITTRLVDMYTYRVMFADNIYVEPAEIRASIETLAKSINDKGLEMTQNPTEADIQKQLKAKNYSEAKRLSDIFLRAVPDSRTVREMYPQIVSGLADEHYKKAKSLLGKRMFDEARSRINQALAFRIDESFYALREKINITEEEWLFKQQILETRRKDQLQKQASGISTGWDGIDSWYENLSAEGAYIGAVMHTPLDPGTIVPDFSAPSWGAEVFWLDAAGKEAKGTSVFNWMAYIGGFARYSPSPAGALIAASGYLSPFLAESLKLGNIIISLGADAGGYATFGARSSDGSNLNGGFTVGAMGAVSAKAWEKMGLFVSAKADALLDFSSGIKYELNLRFAAGLSF